MSRPITDIVNEGEALGVSGGVAASVPIAAGQSDADGYRIPVKDETGAVVGYVGFSVGAGDAIAMWRGDANDIIDNGAPNLHVLATGVGLCTSGYTHYVWVGENGSASADVGQWYLEADGDIGFWATDAGADVYLGAPNGTVRLEGGLVKLVSASATGVDGTATPSTVAELADVLVALGVIASHTIT